MSAAINVATYIIGIAIGVVTIVVGSSNPAQNGEAFIAFGIWAILSTIWAGLWEARGTFKPDFSKRGVIAKFSEVGEVVTIPVAIGLVIVIIIALL